MQGLGFWIQGLGFRLKVLLIRLYRSWVWVSRFMVRSGDMET